MRQAYPIQEIHALLLLLVLMVLPNTAFSVRLFEGNLGSGGNWLQVLDAPAMSDRVYWYELDEDVTYQAQFANDYGFLDVVSDVGGIVTNYVVPDLDVGFYYFRVRAIDSFGNARNWSSTGTLEVVEDLEWPKAAILFPLAGQTFSKGDKIGIELEVSDDTVLRMAQFTINGEYAGVRGLMTEGYKLKPSFGEPRIVVFNYQIPTNGKAGSLEISVDVSDVMYRSVKRTVVTNAVKAGGKGGRNK